MDATAETIPASTREDYKSRPGALIWFFRKSPDGWKRKYQDLKATVKGSTNRIADLTQSRQQWRAKAEQAGERVSALEAELAGLRAQVAAAAGKKTGIGRWPAEARPLRHQDLEPIALVPMASSTQSTVAVCLEDAVDRTGAPRAILTDHGADLHGGVAIFREAHPEASEVYDLTHKAACLLKAR